MKNTNRKPRKNIFKKCGGGVLLSLCNISLIGVGFSSWVITGAGTSINLKVEVGDLQEDDYGQSSFYVKNSEKGFGFYCFENQYYYTDTSLSFQIKVRPDLLESIFGTPDVDFDFSLYYSSKTYLNYFSSANYPSLNAPTYVTLKLSDYGQRFIHSGKLSTSTSSLNSTHTYKLSGTALLYSPSKASIYSLTKDYQSGTKYVFVDVVFDFSINGNLDDNFRNTSFGFMCNLEESA